MPCQFLLFTFVVSFVVCAVVICENVQSFDRPEPFPIPEHSRDWSKPVSDYHPKLWDVECAEGQCDPPITSINFQLPEDGVDRSRALACGQRMFFKTIDGKPLNPAGRTGIEGRGLLARWGPNHLIRVLVIDSISRKPYLLVNRNDDGQNNYLSHFVDDPKDNFFPVDFEISLRKALHMRIKSASKVEKLLKTAKQNSVLVLSGSIPSDLNTDNAWVEQRVYVLSCARNILLCKFGIHAIASEQGFEWEKLNNKSNRMNSTTVEEYQRSGLLDNDPKRYSTFCVAKVQNRGFRLADKFVKLVGILLFVVVGILNCAIALFTSPVWIPLLFYLRFSKKNQPRIDSVRRRLEKKLL